MPEKILISRTDNIGDVVLTLPMAGLLKEKFPQARIAFLGKPYTRSVVSQSRHIDQFYDWEDLKNKNLDFIGADVVVHVFPRKDIAQAARKAKIPLRIGTSHRVFHWWNCNRLISFSRRKSTLHEAQLNLKLLEPLGLEVLPVESLYQYYGWKHPIPLPPELESLLSKEKFNLIFHMKSKGSAKEWPMEYYFQLARELSQDKYNILISGTQEEGEMIRKQNFKILSLPHVTDVTGLFSLRVFIDFIAEADGLLACSTGPLHLAAACGIHTLGLYPSTAPIHAGRWAPIGIRASYLQEVTESPSETLLQGIPVVQVREKISNWDKLDRFGPG